MATFIEEIGRAVKQTACAVIATNDSVNGFMQGIGFPGADSYRNVTRALRRQLCDNADDTVPTNPDADFTGGQCSGVVYNVSLTHTTQSWISGCTPSTILTSVKTGTVTGPVKRFYFRLFGSGSCGPSSAEIRVDDGQGDRVWSSAFTNVPTGRVIDGHQITSIQLSRQDGQADICGDPPPIIPPYTPAPTTINIEYENNNQTTINEDVDVTIFAPQVNIGGAIFAPVTIAGNTFNLVGTVELTPEFKLNVSPEVNVNLGGGNTDSPVPEPDGDIPEPTIDPDERRVIVGAIVTATSVSDRVDFLPQGDNPDVGLPDLGLINFYISTANGTAWTGDIKVKNVRSYIPCPVTTGAIDVAGTARNGVQLDVQPVWGYPGQNLPT